ncbi:MAG TPA: HAD-IIB family hydrolase [Vicinamibacterales bacterium]|nr:HAD-IIB family hydrolase [Vicinamibacterales bacterium]
MRYLVLAVDYDETLADRGLVAPATLEALERVRASGRRLLLVTGRQLDDLLHVFPEAGRFDLVVAENGALLYEPATRETRLLGEPPPATFLDELARRGVSPLSSGRVIVATHRPNETIVLEAIRDLGLELHVIFNKGAVMVLPAGVNKGSGLLAALHRLGLSRHNVVGVGDAENDHAFLGLCECAVAVANALPMVRQRADLVTERSNGAGVVEVAERLLADDLASAEPRLARHHLILGETADGAPVTLPPYGVNLLVAGTSGSGKSRIAAALLEQLLERDYQFCVIDPEGDYERFEGAVVLGDRDHPPPLAEVSDVTRKPDGNVVINLLGVPLHDRPAAFQAVLARVLELRTRTGRPHWVAIDEAHHVLPASRPPSALGLPPRLQGFLLVTVHPERIARPVLDAIDLVVALGAAPEETLAAFAAATDRSLAGPRASERSSRGPDDRRSDSAGALAPGEALLWRPREGREPLRIRTAAPRADRPRHRRKYAEGELGPDRSFYFRGPDGRLNLRAQNLSLFLQLAEGVDDATWLHHLRRGDYSRWFREAIKDDSLADAARAIEQLDLPAAQSRARIRAAIEERFGPGA